MAEPAIATEALTKRYGELTAVDHLDLRVKRGEVFGLLGPNGAGKTTTILMLLGLTEPTEGKARVVGLDPAFNALEVKARVGYMPDMVGFYEHLTGRQNLRYTARLNHLPRDEGQARVATVLDEVGLADRADDKVRTYSRGMRQRLGLADALLKDPEVLVLDEPTAAIDPEGVREILELIRRLPEQRGVTILLSSHLLQQVQAVCDRIGIFVSGRMVVSGSVTDLAARHGGRLVIEVRTTAGPEGADPAAVMRGLRDVVEVRRDPGGLWLIGAQHDVREHLARRLSDVGFVVTHMVLRTEELGEIYHRYFTPENEIANGIDGDDDRDRTSR